MEAIRKRKRLAGIMLGCLAVSLLVSCKGTTTLDDGTHIMEVEKISSKTISGPLGELSTGGGEMGEGEAEAPPSGDRPEMPEGEGGTLASGEGPGNGEAPPEGEPPSGFGGSTFTAAEDGETAEITVTDDTVITVEFMQGSQEGDLDSISEGSIIEVKMEDGKAVEILVKNLNNGGGFGGSDTVTNGTAANTIDADSDLEGKEYDSTGDDENALRVDSGVVTLNNSKVNKTDGESSNTEDGDFYGQNASFLALNESDVTIQNSEFNSSVVNGNGVFSYGEGTIVNISNSTIKTSGDHSGGLQTTGGAEMNASKLTVETQGKSSAAIRSDRGGGTVTVDGGTYKTTGTGSPAIYSTADITVSNAELTAEASEGVAIEGENSVKLIDSKVTGNMQERTANSGENLQAVLIYQSMSGDSEIGSSAFSAEGGSITSLSGDLFHVTNTHCTIDLKAVELTLANDVFLRAAGNDGTNGWGNTGANGGEVELTADEQNIAGEIIVDEISTLSLSLKNGSAFKGMVNTKGEEGEVKVTLSADSSWTLTGDSYITSFDGESSSIDKNGYTLYIDGEKAE